MEAGALSVTVQQPVLNLFTLKIQENYTKKCWIVVPSTFFYSYIS